MKQDSDILYISTHADEIITRILWPDGPVCPVCGCKEYIIMKDGRHRCKHCHKIYNIKTNTIFSGTRLPLSKWLICLYLMLESKGIGSNAMAKYIGLSQSTCYFMMMKLRFLFSQEDTKLEGEIAIDEEYIGGQFSRFSISKRNILLTKFKLPKRPKTIVEKLSVANKVNSLYKQPVIGMNDGHKLILRAVPSPVNREDVLHIFKKHSIGSGWTVSDCGALYDNWYRDTGYYISQNNHSKCQYVANDGRSSNRIEGSFSQWKRQSLDKYCSLGKRTVQLYLDEHCFRFNNRDLTILQKIAKALSKAHQKVNRDDIRRYNSLAEFPIRQHKLFDPYEFFRNEGFLLDSVQNGGIVYRREEFVND